MTILAHILNSKPDHTVYTTTPTTSVFDAVKLMAEKSIGALVVTEGERVAGMVTERDYARKIVLMARSSKETAVRDIMTTNLRRGLVWLSSSRFGEADLRRCGKSAVGSAHVNQ
jgi:CBS domain-containing protein